MNFATWLGGAMLSVSVLLNVGYSQQAGTAPGSTNEPKTATPTAPGGERAVFQKVEPPGTPAEKPAVVKPDGTPAPTGEAPKPVVTKETQPAGAPVPPPSEQPKLSAPVPPPEVAPKLPIRYFALIFGSQSSPKRARFTHTWFTIVKATPKANLVDYDPNGNLVKYYDLTAHTISWLPSSGRVRVLKLRPDCGHNFSLHETLRITRSQGECLALWGPYEVNPLVSDDLYNRTVKQIQRLNSGAVLYKAIDPDQKPASLRIADCIHAVTDMDGPGRRSNYDEFQRYGFDASSHLAAVMIRANRLDDSATHEWVADALELNRYPIQRRTINVCRPVQPQPAQMQTVRNTETVAPPPASVARQPAATPITSR